MKNFKVFLRVMALCLLVCMTFVSCNSGDSATETANTNEESTNGAMEADSEPKDKTVINAMSYNLWGGNANKTTTSNGVDLPRMNVVFRGPKVNAMLNGEDIDVAGFQEASSLHGWVEWIENGLDKNYSYISADTSNRGLGIYIVYKKDRFEIVDSGAFCLVDGAPSLDPEKEQKFEDSDFERICNWAIFKIKETGELFLFMDTHLLAGLSSSAAANVTESQVRSKQVEVLIFKMSAIRETVKKTYGVSNCPVILVGDMNCTPTSTEHSIITQTLNDSLRVSKGHKENESYNTHTGFWYCKTEADYKAANKRIDYVFVSKENISVLNYKMVHTSTNLCPYGEYMSDHNAVIAQLELS